MGQRKGPLWQGTAIAVTGSLLIALGWWAGELRARSTDTEVRKRLLRNTIEIAGNVNPELAKKLTFTAADKGTAAFNQLQRHFATARRMFTQGGIYTMALREGTIFFGPESYPASGLSAGPPGTVNRQPPREFLQVFTDKRPVTVGPVTDEYGTFVSSIAPVRDPHTDEVLMAVGVDVLSEDWQASLNSARRGPLLTILATMPFLAGCAAIIRWRNRRMRPETVKFKVWIITPASLAMAAGLMVYGAYEYWEYKGNSFDRMAHTAEQAQARWQQSIASEVQLLRAQIDHIAQNPAMLNAYLERDLPTLTGLSLPVGEQLKREFRISHFYFIGPDRTIFLRVHQPDRRGDLIDRSTLITAEQAGEDSWGLELGPLGTFTLRYVRPWKQDGQTTGYLELGIEIEHLVNQLAQEMNLDLLTVIWKKHTTREKFEAGRQAFGFAGEWDAYAEFVVAHQSIPELPKEVPYWLEHDHNPATPIGIFSAALGERRWVCGSIHLPDASGHGVADLILMHDVAAENALGQSALLRNLSLAIVLFGGLLVLLWSVTGTAERQLGGAFTRLRESEQSYRQQFFDNSAAMMLIDPADGTVVEANDAAITFYGYSRDRLLAMHLSEINAVPDREVQLSMASVREEKRQQFKFQHRLADGSLRDVEVSTSPINLGNRTLLHSIIHDVTERRRAEELLKESEERLREVLENSLAASYKRDLQADCYKYLSPVFTGLSGYTPDEITSLPTEAITDLMHPDDRGEVRRLIASALSDPPGKAFQIQYRFKHKDGRYRWLLDQFTVLRDEYGQSLALIGSVNDITERKQTEDALAQERRHLAGIIEGTNVGTWEWNVQTGETIFNNRWAEIIGYTLDDLSPVSIHTWTNLVHPDDLITSTELLEKHFRGERDYYELEARMRHKDGSWVWILDRGKVTSRTEDGKPLLMQGTHQEVTDRKRVEDLLRQTTNRLSLAVQAGGVGIWDYDVVNNRLVWDEQMFRLYGITQEQFGGAYEAWLAGVHPEDLQRSDKEIQRALQGEKDFNTTFRVVWPDGSIHSIRALARVERDGSGQPLNMIGTNWDITDQRRAEEALRESESRLRAITASAQDAILMIDPNGNISFWNPAAERILGYTSEETAGQNLHNLLVPQKYQPLHFAAFPGFQKTGQGGAIGKTLELQARRKDGEEIPVEVSLSAVYINGWHAVGLLRDITQRKRAESELRDTNMQLEAATALANSMAAQAEMANVAKSEFLANMSHEIRTPMNGVIGMTGLLLDTPLNQEQRQYAEIVRSSGESLLTIINDILDFSKIEAKKLSLEMLDFDLRTTLEDTIEVLAVKAQEKGLELTCLVEPEVPSLLKGDPGRLRQILTNLTGNSIKFTSAGEVVIRVLLENENERSTTLRFSVMDTGIGIPADRIGSLFRPFVQVDGSTTRKYGGTGLGLSISRQLVEMMGGAITGESQEGKGSTFSFTAAFEKQTGDIHDRTPLLTDLKGFKVLAVDDHGTNRLLISKLLTTWECRHAEACDGASAISALRQAVLEGDPFQAALIDMQMPGMDGETLGRRIKADEMLNATRLVMMTSLGRRGDAKSLEQAGFCAYLTKPIRQDQLRGCLLLALGVSGGSGGAKQIITRHTISEAKKRSIRILIAEDNITNQQVAKAILGKLGFKADTVANGKEAVAALKAVPYDLVLMDCQMPEMDGYEATRVIRQAASGLLKPNIPVIAMTANAMKGDREKCLEAGMNDYIAKPISPFGIAEVLDRHLRDTEHPQTPHAPEFRSNGPDMGGSEGESKLKVADRDDHSVPVFDRTAFLDRMLGDEGLMGTVLKGFIEDIPRQVSTLKGHVQNSEVEHAGVQAHKIKGAAANVGSLRLSAVAARMEKAGKDSDLKELQRLLPKLEQEFTDLRHAIQGE